MKYPIWKGFDTVKPGMVFAHCSEVILTYFFIIPQLLSKRNVSTVSRNSGLYFSFDTFRQNCMRYCLRR